MEFKRICKEFDLKLLQLDTWGMLSSEEVDYKVAQKNSLLKEYENNNISLDQFEFQVEKLTEGLDIPSKEEMLSRCKALY
ncbi:hypothetical protein [Pseudobutyrivibrio sp.]|uniref:hypothetical protein n=1 Tax=Pseudobutyrivibrio sp. TaxID=2014367 RepID=UPI001D38A289|nr:hypothetical protein [Pseudobutyrivibrio sp.]MBE5911232.1 hypothetical protein [Pseudobutyrivibrio sp.]